MPTQLDFIIAMYQQLPYASYFHSFDYRFLMGISCPCPIIVHWLVVLAGEAASLSFWSICCYLYSQGITLRPKEEDDILPKDLKRQAGLSN